MFTRRKKRGQVTIFIIIALILVVLVGGYFLFKDSIQKSTLPVFVEPIENSFLSCLKEKTLAGISILETNGGYIQEVSFESGSTYMPFSSHLSFMGNEIPYWFYVSGGNVAKEQVPTKEFMENELENYLEEEVINCGFEDYFEEGYLITKGVGDAVVEILDKKVKIDLKMNLVIEKGEGSYIIKNHDFEVKSNLGNLYDSAMKVYEQEKEILFLEKYGVDALRLYAPVDGVELSCAPLVWNAEEVFEELKQAIELNTFALKSSGAKKDYYLVENSWDNEVRFVYSQDWPYSFEVSPTQGFTLISEPVGNQKGLGILGFCYVSYHFVYDLAYPVLVQVYKDDEVFQFPVAVVIKGNVPREPLEGTSFAYEDPGICDNKISLIDVGVVDSNLNSLDANISFECFNSRCGIEKVSEGSSQFLFPQCVNGKLIVNSEGFKEYKLTYSSVNGGSLFVVLDKEFEKEISLFVDGKAYFNEAIISFVSEGDFQTIVYPETKKLILSEGIYEVQVYIYENSSLKFDETTYEQCVDVPSGVGGFVGVTKKECFEVNVPEQIISKSLVGGGKNEIYFTEFELQSFDKIKINVDELNVPKSLEDLQNNYILFEDKSIGVELI